MNQVSNIVKDVCENWDVELEPFPDGTGFKFVMAGENSLFPGAIIIDEDCGMISIMTYVPVRAPKNIRPQMTELLVRINEKIFLGNFEMNMERGSIWYKTSAIFDTADVHQDSIQHLLYANWIMIDKYFYVISTVLFGKIDPERALKCFEQAEAEHHKSKNITNLSQLHRRNLGDIDGLSLN